MIKELVSIVATLSALYPLVTIVLGIVLLQEAIVYKQAIGMGLAVVEIAFLAI